MKTYFITAGVGFPFMVGHATGTNYGDVSMTNLPEKY
jgi:hypothetical protein